MKEIRLVGIVLVRVKFGEQISRIVIIDTPNNANVSKALLQVDLIDNYKARLLISDTDPERNYTVRDQVFKRPAWSIEARLSQVGFSFSNVNDSINFGFRNIYTD